MILVRIFKKGTPFGIPSTIYRYSKCLVFLIAYDLDFALIQLVYGNA